MIDVEARNEMFDSVIANRGGTFAFDGRPVSPSSGYAVSLEGFEVKVPVKGISPPNLANLVNQLVAKVEGLADPSTHFVGMWIDKGNLYVDLSVLVEDKVQAVSKGIAQSQLAIWDFANDESISL